VLTQSLKSQQCVHMRVKENRLVGLSGAGRLGIKSAGVAC
jgi:hypothetical protein